MSYKRGRALDGYTLTTGNNTFISPWIDVHSSPYVGFAVVFTATGTQGTLTVEQSYDKEAVWTDGRTYPASAQFVGAYGLGPLGDPVDLITVPGTSQAVNGATTLIYVPMNSNIASAGFYRVKYIASASAAGKVTVTYSWKTTS